MPTVDDLIISLTIKETSKLGKLQKTLEAFQEGKVVQKGFDSGLKVTIQKIKNKLSSLVGRRIATKEQPSKMALQAVALRKDLKEDVRNLAEKLIPQKGVATMMEEFGAETREDLVDAMRDKIDEWIKRLELIISKDWTSESATGFMAAIRDFVSRGDMTDDLRKVFIERVERKIGEFNKEIADLLRSAGIKAISEFKAYILKPESRSGLRGGVTPLSSLNKFLNLEEGLGKELFDKVMRTTASLVASKRRTPTDVFNELVKMLDIKLTPELFKQPKKWLEDPKLAAVLAGVFRQVEQTQGEKAIPQGIHKAIKTLLEEFYSKKGAKFTQIRPDIAVLQGDFEKLKEVFNEDIAKAISENQLGFIELKQILSESNVAQIANYKEMLGNITAVASVVRKSFEEMLPDIKKGQMNVLNKLTQLSAHKILNEEEVKQLQEMAEKEITSESLMSIIKAEQKAIQNLSTKEDIDKIKKEQEKTNKMLEERRSQIENVPDEF